MSLIGFDMIRNENYMNLLKSIFRIAKSIILIVLMTIIVAFCLNNNQTVIISLNPIPFEIEAKLFLLIMIVFVVGFSLGLVISGISLVRVKISNFFTNHKANRLQLKLEKLTREKLQ